MPVMLNQATKQTEVTRIALRGEPRTACGGTAGGEDEDRHLRVCVAASEDAQPKTPAMWPFLTEGDVHGSALVFWGMKNGDAEVRPPGMKKEERNVQRPTLNFQRSEGMGK